MNEKRNQVYSFKFCIWSGRTVKTFTEIKKPRRRESDLERESKVLFSLVRVTKRKQKRKGEKTFCSVHLNEKVKEEVEYNPELRGEVKTRD